MAKARSLDHQIWEIAGPAILSNISIPLLGLVDMAILGHLGTPDYLGAVAIGAAILSFLYWGFSFLRTGTTGLVARAHGAGQHSAELLVLGQACVLAVALALAVFILHPLWLSLGIALMAPADQLAPLAHSYAQIRIFSAPAVLVTYACVGWFIGRGNTRWPMVIVVITNSANIGLDFLFIIGLGLNSDGAAMATVVAEYLGCAVALWAVWRKLPARPDQVFYRQLRSWSAYGTLLRSSRHLFIRTVCLLFSFAFFTAMGEKFGGNTLAANALVMQLLLFAAYAMDGFAFAAEALAGHRVGAADLPAFRAAVRRCAIWCGGTAVLLSAVFAVAGPPLFALLTDLPEVYDTMMRYRWWLVALPVVAAPSYLLDGIFIGTAETRYLMYTMMVSLALVYLPVWYVSRGWGNHGLWLAFTLFNAARGITLQWCYNRLSRRAGWLR